jgi:hypothetical protein
LSTDLFGDLVHVMKNGLYATLTPLLGVEMRSEKFQYLFIEIVFLFSFISLFKKISRKWRGYFYNLFLKLKYFLFMNFLEDVHEHTWIKKKFQIFFVHEFPWGLSWMSMEEFRTRIVVEKLSDIFTRVIIQNSMENRKKITVLHYAPFVFYQIRLRDKTTLKS